MGLQLDLAYKKIKKIVYLIKKLEITFNNYNGYNTTGKSISHDVERWIYNILDLELDINNIVLEYLRERDEESIEVSDKNKKTYYKTKGGCKCINDEDLCVFITKLTSEFIDYVNCINHQNILCSD